MADDAPPATGPIAASPRSCRPSGPHSTPRARVVARGLTMKAFAALTPLVTGLGLSLEALGPVKQLQKRFFSDVPWTHGRR